MTTPNPHSRKWPGYLRDFVAGSLGAFLLATLVGRWFPGTETCVRSTGGFLQLAGLLSVAYGIKGVRREHHLRSTILEILDDGVQALQSGVDRLLLALHLRRPPPIVVEVSSAALTLAGLSVQGTGRTEPDATLTQRVDLLERRIEGTEEALGRTQEALERETEQRSEAVASERQDRATAIATVRSEIRTVAVGGLRLQTIGLWWLFLGVLVATWSQEAAKPLSGVKFGCIGQAAPPPAPARWH